MRQHSFLLYVRCYVMITSSVLHSGPSARARVSVSDRFIRGMQRLVPPFLPLQLELPKDRPPPPPSTPLILVGPPLLRVPDDRACHLPPLLLLPPNSDAAATSTGDTVSDSHYYYQTPEGSWRFATPPTISDFTTTTAGHQGLPFPVSVRLFLSFATPD